MEFVIAVAGGMILLGIILMLGGEPNKPSKFQKKIKGKYTSLPDVSLMFGSKKRRR